MSGINNFFIDKNALRTIDTSRIVYAIVSILAFFSTEIGRNIYRPFIYRNNIDDFGVADSIGNLGGVVVQIFFTLAILNSPKQKAIRVILFIILGYIVYELLQPYLPKGVFDWKDIYGTLIGGLISTIIWFSINTIVNKRIFYKF